MAQHDMILENATGLTFRTDLNGALAATVTNNSGAVEPPTKYPGMLWLDLSITPNGGLRMRNQTNTGWQQLVFADEPTVGDAGAAILSTENSVYAGLDAANTAFPVGTTLLVKSTANLERNEVVGVKLSDTIGQYDLIGATAVAGTWRARGTMGAASDWTILVQRIS